MSNPNNQNRNFFLQPDENVEDIPINRIFRQMFLLRQKASQVPIGTRYSYQLVQISLMKELERRGFSIKDL